MYIRGECEYSNAEEVKESLIRNSESEMEDTHVVVVGLCGERDESSMRCAVRCLSPASKRRSKSVRHEASDLFPLFFDVSMSHLLACEHAPAGSPGRGRYIF